ncbi:MAG: sensor histidine kinase [Candidatus Dormibacteraceae bacterium]
MVRARDKIHRDILIDAALAAGVIAVIAAAIAADLGPGRHPGPIAYLFAVGLGLLMLVRRQYPGLALVATAVGLLGYYVAGYPPIGLSVPVAAALYSAAERGRLSLAIGVAGALIVIAFAYRLAVGQSPVYLFGYELAVTLTLMAAAMALGYAARWRRLLRAELEGRRREAAAENERESVRRVEAERLRIARDVHDVLAHTVAVVSLQADVATEALADHPAAVARALATIRSAGSEANRQLRATLGLLRRPDDPEPRAPTGGLDQLDRLVRATSECGPRVEMRVEGQETALPVEVDTTAYRIVQESLTNALRHARANNVEVLLRFARERLEIQVIDDGQGAPEVVEVRRRQAGGLVGMGERAALLGGTLWAGNLSGGGFAVRATVSTAGLR